MLILLYLDDWVVLLDDLASYDSTAINYKITTNNIMPAQLPTNVNNVLDIILHWLFGSIFRLIFITSNSIQQLNIPRNGERFVYLPPSPNKRLYFAPFVFGVLLNTNTIPLALEIIYSMMLTPSVTGWVHGVEDAVNSFDGTTNFFMLFIHCNLLRYGTVSGGGHTRRQVSSGYRITNADIYRSLSNLLRIIHLANRTNNTNEILRLMCSSVNEGGVRGVGMLIAQEMLSVLTFTNIITNPVHINNIVISAGTQTARRLQHLGFANSQQQHQLMETLTTETSLPPHIIENVLCEALRARYAPDRTVYDTIDTHGYLFDYNNINGTAYLHVFDLLGRIDIDFEMPEWRMPTDNDEYNGVRWWEDNYEEQLPHLVEGEQVLSLRSRSR